MLNMLEVSGQASEHHAMVASPEAFSDANNNESFSDIAGFFEDRTIFITGATGFVGKALVEKILRACPGVRRIYVLVRTKPGTAIETRLTELLDNVIFQNLKLDSPKSLTKVVPIQGDIGLPGLGLSNDDQKKLCDQVSVVIHSAATVKFNEKLKLSLELNVNGTRRMIGLCKEMPSLVSLVHVSTAYANCDRSVINEVIYPLETEPEKLLDRLEGLTEGAVDALTISEDLVENRPNTYTFTKAMAECLLNKERHNLPACIVRPSIVTATWREPMPGWIDNISGLTGFIAAWGKGVLRSAMVHEDKVVDLVPVDVLVNLILAAAWDTASNPRTADSIPVYNCCTGAENPVRWRDMARYGNACLIRNPFSGTVWYPGIALKTDPFWARVSDFVNHYVPAHCMDAVALVYGKKRRGLRVYESLQRALRTIHFFTTHEWVFTTGKMGELYGKLSTRDQALFNFDIKNISWESYMEGYCLGVRENILKQDRSTIPEARVRIQRIFWAQKVMQFLFMLLVFNVLLNSLG